MSPDVLIIGAGAAGLMCAIEAGKRGRRVMIVDHSTKIAEKIRISGGGRCNFTNIHCAPDRFLSNDPQFCVTALRRYTQHDFIKMVERHKIPYHEKTLGQLFCDHSARDIIDMLLDECADYGVEIKIGTTIDGITQAHDGRFIAMTSHGEINAASLVIASGGLSIPKIGATSFGYDIAQQFGLNLIDTRPGLVPLTFAPDMLAYTGELSGLAVDPVAVQSQDGKIFDEALLFTHRGISGPAILQISSYWKTGEEISVNLVPDLDVFAWLKQQRDRQSRSQPHNVLAELLPKRLAQRIVDDVGVFYKMAELGNKTLEDFTRRITSWRVKPAGSEGYRTAEVTLGGVDTAELSPETFAAHKIPNLYFIGEVVDVTGHLGGYNFQWAWSSGWCAGQHV
ncbi:MAG: NAD(FAD)-utilizing dehydrogenase [Alphaproteobacteria bacterium]|nr:NAD(FAD)-utilizing dehydrogenase [Alphaproteobacteria bacterium]